MSHRPLAAPLHAGTVWRRRGAAPELKSGDPAPCHRTSSGRSGSYPTLAYRHLQLPRHRDGICGGGRSLIRERLLNVGGDVTGWQFTS